MTFADYTRLEGRILDAAGTPKSVEHLRDAEELVAENPDAPWVFFLLGYARTCALEW